MYTQTIAIIFDVSRAIMALDHSRLVSLHIDVKRLNFFVLKGGQNKKINPNFLFEKFSWKNLVNKSGDV